MRRMYSENQIERKVQEVEKDISTLVDKDGHERFIEGDIAVPTVSGVTFTYNKWSLSGTHLMIVLALSVANETVIDSSTELGTITIPAWVGEKLIPIFGTVLARDTKYYYASDYSSQNQVVNVQKVNNTTLKINTGGLTLSADRNARITFDFLIDND